MLRFALILAVATPLLNGSVAVAMTQPGCAAPAVAVCALSLDAPEMLHAASLIDETPALARVAPPRRPADLAARAEGRSLAEIAPPARPAGLVARNAAARATAVDLPAEPSLAELAPPARPAHLTDTAALR